MCGIALGMKFVHSNGIIHRDLKPGNIMINTRGEALIGDFGVCQFESDDHTLNWDCGTARYAAPELFCEGTICTTKVDVFGFGLVLFEILTGRAAFPSSMAILAAVAKIRYGRMPPIPDECGKYMQGLITRCWSRNPEHRPSFDEIIREFKEVEFSIFPHVIASRVSTYVSSIEEWEMLGPT
jgi:serine/threonine protein kinase